jgi:hypothetical protein
MPSRPVVSWRVRSNGKRSGLIRSKTGDWMATLLQAQNTLVATRAFFKPGEKASNKQYGDGVSKFFDPLGATRAVPLALGRNINFFNAQDKVTRRDTNREASSQLQNAEGDITAGGTTPPLDVGTARVTGGLRYGNCGVMACVAIHFAHWQEHVPRNQLFCVTVYNRNYTEGFGIFQKNMTFGHSWALLGNHPPILGVPNYVVDPWADVVCDQANFANDLTAALNAWAGQGKRIWVNWSNGNVWTTANDAAILSLAGAAPTYRAA